MPCASFASLLLCRSMLTTYELAYLFNPAAAEEKVNEEISKWRQMLEATGGVFLTEELPRARSLAYEIEKKIAEKKNHFKEAYFGSMRFESAGETLPNLRKELDANSNVLRYLLTKVIKYKPLPIRSIPLSKPKITTDGETKTALSEEELDKEIEGLLAPVM